MELPSTIYFVAIVDEERFFFFFKRKAKFKVLVAFERFSMECKESMWNELNIVELRGEI